MCVCVRARVCVCESMWTREWEERERERGWAEYSHATVTARCSPLEMAIQERLIDRHERHGPGQTDGEEGEVALEPRVDLH